MPITSIPASSNIAFRQGRENSVFRLAMSVEPCRFMFLTHMWPTGVIDVASYLVNKNLAEALVVRRAGVRISSLSSKLFKSLPPSEWGEVEIPISPRLQYALRAGGVFPSRDTRISWCVAEGEWRLTDPNRFDLRIRQEGKKLVILDEANRQQSLLERALADSAFRPERARLLTGWLNTNGGLSAAAEKALTLCGGGCLAELVRFNPQLIGLRSEEVGQWGNLQELITNLRDLIDAWIVIGGPAVTQAPNDALAATGADFGVIGEGERSAAALVVNLGGRRPSDGWDGDGSWLLETDGLVYRYGGGVSHNSLPLDGYGLDGWEGERTGTEIQQRRRPFLTKPELNDSRLRWELMRGYAGIDSQPTTWGIHHHAARGCVYACDICEHFFGRILRAKSAANMREEILELKELIDAGQVTSSRLADGRISYSLSEDDFLLYPKRARELFTWWQDAGMNEHFQLSLSSNPRTLVRNSEFFKEVLSLLGKLGARLQLGVESFHPEVLARLGKPHTVEESQLVLNKLESNRVPYATFIIIEDYAGTPTEALDCLWLLANEHISRPGMMVFWNVLVIPGFLADVRHSLDASLLREAYVSPGYYREVHPELLGALMYRMLTTIDRYSVGISGQAASQSERKTAYLSLFEKLRTAIEEEQSVSGKNYGHLFQQLDWISKQIKGIPVLV